MGDHLQTCAITNLPIREGDDVVALLVATAKKADLDWNGSTGSTGAFHRVASLPFNGTHDGYGGIDITRSEHADAVSTSTGGRTMAQRLEGMADRPATYEGDDLHLVMMHVGAWDRLASFRRGRNGEPGAPSDEIDPHVMLLDLWTRNDDAPMGTKRPKDAPKGQDGWFFGSAMLDWRWKHAYPDDTCPLVAHLFGVNSELGSHPFLAMQVRKAIGAALDAGDRGMALDLMKEASRFVAGDVALQRLRKHWSPQIGVGVQDANALLHIEINEWALEMARTIASEDVLLNDEAATPSP